MSRCSKKCNEIKKIIDSISGLDDDYIYSWLKSLESVTVSIVGFINHYADRNELNGTCFKEDGINIQDIEELTLDEEYEIDPMHFGMGQLKYKPNARKMHDKINEIIKNVNQISRQLDNKINK